MGSTLFVSVFGFFRRRVPFLNRGLGFLSGVVDACVILALLAALIAADIAVFLHGLLRKIPLVGALLDLAVALVKLFGSFVWLLLRIAWRLVCIVFLLARFVVTWAFRVGRFTVWTVPKSAAKIAFVILKHVGFWSVFAGIILPLIVIALVVAAVGLLAAWTFERIVGMIDWIRDRYVIIDRTLDVLDWFLKLPFRLLALALRLARRIILIVLIIAVTVTIGPVAFLVAAAFGVLGLKVDLAVGTFRLLRRKVRPFDWAVRTGVRTGVGAASLVRVVVVSVAHAMTVACGTVWRMRFAIAAVAVFVGAGLGAYAFWTNLNDNYQQSGNYAVKTHTHASFGLNTRDVYVDPDTIYAFPDRETSDAFFESVRPLLLLYADENGEIAETVEAIGIVISDKYVVTTADYLTLQEDVVLAGAVLFPTVQDRNQAPEFLEGWRVENAAPFFLVFERPQVPVLDAKPLTLGDGAGVKAGDELIALLPGGAVKRKVQDRHRVEGEDTIAFYVEPTGSGSPLFVLRNGKPEFVGMAADPEGAFLTFAVDTRAFERLGYVFDLENLKPKVAPPTESDE